MKPKNLKLIAKTEEDLRVVSAHLQDSIVNVTDIANLKKNKIVGITGIDTRSLTNFIRDKGAPKATIAYSKNGKFKVCKLIHDLNDAYQKLVRKDTAA